MWASGPHEKDFNFELCMEWQNKWGEINISNFDNDRVWTQEPWDLVGWYHVKNQKLK